LIRHSSILGNDDEFEETMEPFISKIKSFQKKGGRRGKKGKKSAKLPRKGDWAFLQDWDSPIVEETLEKLSERGKTDSEVCHEYALGAEDVADRVGLGQVFPTSV
jgi:acid phosphatase